MTNPINGYSGSMVCTASNCGGDGYEKKEQNRLVVFMCLKDQLVRMVMQPGVVLVAIVNLILVIKIN